MRSSARYASGQRHARRRDDAEALEDRLALGLGVRVAEACSGECFERHRYLVVRLELTRQLEAPLESRTRLVLPARLDEGIAVEPFEEGVQDPVLPGRLEHGRRDF